MEDSRSEVTGGESRRVRWAAALVALVYLAAAALMMPDYGPTTDVVLGSIPYGDRAVSWMAAGGGDFVDSVQSTAPIEMRRPYLDLGGPRFEWFQVYPLAAILSGLSNQLFWNELGVLPPVAAHLLVVPLAVALLVFALTVFLARRIGLPAALGSSLLLLASPRFLSHSMGNLKDVPECVLYTLAYLAAFRALHSRSARPWIGFGLATALALAQKANALFLPLQVLVFYAVARPSWRRRMRPSWKGPLLAVGVFAAAYFAASPPFWHETVERVVRLYRQVLKIGFSIEVDTLFEVERSWMEVFSAPLDVAITTPLPVLALAVLGVLRGRSFGGLKRFLCVGAVFPVLRTQLPGARDFDGVRHFLEFYPCLCALAGLGLLVLLEETRERWRSRALQLAVPAACLAPGLVGVISTYPFGIAYFNALVGGLAGAQAAGVPEATDYWGGSYWQGQAWLSEHADPESSLVVPIHDPVVRSTAPLRLRSDIRVQPRTAAKCPGTLWVMFVTHRGFYGRLTKYLEARAEPVHRIRVQGGTILAIYRLAGEAEKLEAFERIRQDRELVRMIQALSLWIREDPDRRKLFTGVVASIVAGEHERAAQELRDVLGTVTDEQARMLVEWIVELRT